VATAQFVSNADGALLMARLMESWAKSARAWGFLWKTLAQYLSRCSVSGYLPEAFERLQGFGAVM